jgi:hypothetical protein
MFTWLTNSAQNYTYKTALRGLLAVCNGSLELTKPVQVGAVCATITMCRHYVDSAFDVGDILRDTLRPRMNISIREAAYKAECNLLAHAEDMRADGKKMANYTFLMSAAYLSIHKREDFRSKASLEIQDFIRSGARLADQLGVSAMTPMDVAIGMAAKTIGLRFEDYLR